MSKPVFLLSCHDVNVKLQIDHALDRPKMIVA